MKKSVFFTALIIVILCMGVLVGCSALGGKVVENPDTILSGVKQISLSQYKTEYWLGQELDLTGSVLKLLMETGEVKSIDAKNPKTVTVSGYNRFLAGPQKVTVKYGGKMTATFEVMVKVPDVKSISLKSFPTKQNYIEGDRIDMSGAVITVVMENGTSVDFPVDNSIVAGAVLNADKEFVVTGENLELTIRYGTKQIAFAVNVSAKTLIGVKILTWPTNQNYFKGDTSFNPEGLRLEYVYNNNKTQEVDASIQSNLRYVFDFTVASAQSPVTVQYMDGDNILFSVGFTVIVSDARFLSLTITKRPDGVDNLIEGFSDIDYASGRVLVAFDNGETKEFAMNDPVITKSNYDNRVLGEQSIEVFYYNNKNSGNELAKFKVKTEKKRAQSVVLSGVSDIQATQYFEGQDAKISIAKLYYTVHYNNSTVGNATVVSDTALTNGSNLLSTANGGTGGIKRIEFLIDGIVVGFDVNIIPVAVVNVQIDTLPQNRFLSAGSVPSVGGGVLKITYNNQKSEKITMDATGVTLEYTTAGIAPGGIVDVRVFYRKTDGIENPSALYTVTLVDKTAKSVTMQTQPTKSDSYKYGDTVRLAGMVLVVVYADNSSEILTALADIIENGAIAVQFISNIGAGLNIPLKNLMENGRTTLTVSGDVFVYFRGVRATPSFHVSVEERLVSGISVTSTANVKLNMLVGNAYESVAGLKIKVSYTDYSAESVLFGADTARHISENTEVTEAGYYWYTSGSMSEEGTLTVTVVFAVKNKQGQILTYPDNYSVVYSEAKPLRLTGIFVLTGGVYTETETLGSQPKGLTPYLQNYSLGCYFEGDVIKYIPLTAAMTDYDIKDVTTSTRHVTVSFSGLTFVTKINVIDAEITGIAIGTNPRTNYVFTESLSLVGGTLRRTLVIDGATKQDTVEMKEADMRLLNKWPMSVADFSGAPSLIVNVELRYENVHTVIFAVTVYQPLNLDPVITSTQNYYGKVSDPAVSLGLPLPSFVLPTYTLRYSDEHGNDISGGTVPYVDKDGNVVYPAPKNVGNYLVLVISEGNRYYNPLEKSAEFAVSPLSITLTAQNASKTYGTADPKFVYTTTDNDLWNEAKDQLLGGSFTRTSGENVGTYEIRENASDKFAHPCFIISVEVAGKLTIVPALIELEMNPEKLFYEKDGEDGSVNQKEKIGYTFCFISTSSDGTKISVSEDEIIKNAANPAYKRYVQYLTELKPQEGFGRLYLFTLSVKGADGIYSEDLPIAEKGDYQLKMLITAVEGQALNFMFYDENNSHTGVSDEYLSISVVAEPWETPKVGGKTLRLYTTETDLAVLEALVAAAETENATAYDIVATDKFVYIWLYRNTQTVRPSHPEGAYLVYKTVFTAGEWVGEGTGAGGVSGGYIVDKSHLQATAEGGAFISLKFLSNGDDKADSVEIAFQMPNVF